MRHFLPDPIDPAVLARLLEAAHRGPSVGLMQPWRFVRITDSGLRSRIHVVVGDERQSTAGSSGRAARSSCA
jgi:5,6-dimethylbenzimidazole synthase